MIVYLDIIFLYNFLIDLVLLWSTALIFKLRPKWYRLCLGAGIGAGYTLFIFFPALTNFYTFGMKVILSACMIFAAFGFYRWIVFIRRLLIFYMVAFVLGGGLMGVNHLMQTDSQIISGMIVSRSGGFGSPITWIFVVIVLPVLWWLSGKGMNQIKEVNQKAELYAQLTVFIQGQPVSCQGLIDTGNQLYEPITRIPVTILDLELLKHLLPESVYESVKLHKSGQIDTKLLDTEDQWLQRIRIIPFRSVSRVMDLLVALRPDKVRVEMKGECYETSKMLIGLNPASLSSDGSYQAIIHPRIMNSGHILESSVMLKKTDQASSL